MQIIAVSKIFYVDLCELRSWSESKVVAGAEPLFSLEMCSQFCQNTFVLPSESLLKKICREEEEADGPVFQQDVTSGRGTFWN